MKRPSKRKVFSTCLAIFACGLLIRFTEPVDHRLRSAASKAAWTGDVQFLRISRILGIDLNKSVPGRGPLIVSAAYGGQDEVIRYLLSIGVDIESKDKHGGTALSRAAQMRREHTVRMLLEAGADPNVRDREGGNTPLDLCSISKQREDANPEPIAELLSASGGQRNTTHK